MVLLISLLIAVNVFGVRNAGLSEEKNTNFHFAPQIHTANSQILLEELLIRHNEGFGQCALFETSNQSKFNLRFTFFKFPIETGFSRQVFNSCISFWYIY